MKDYLKIFVDSEYPKFLDKYINTPTLERLKNITQFCGCDYTHIYSPLFKYTRFDHSLVVAHMTWHFTHNKTETLAALLHDVGTPCFAHCIDYVFGDYINQESSEVEITKIIEKDKILLNYLKEDNITLQDLKNLDNFHILENQSPKLCTDRLDGVLHTCFIWLHTNSLIEIKEIYDDLIILNNEENFKEIGFQTQMICEKFTKMVKTYAIELQGNKDKYVTNYISELIKKAFSKNLITLEDLYFQKETDIIGILSKNFASWNIFQNTSQIISTNKKPNAFYMSLKVKRRNIIPLIKTPKGPKRIDKISELAKLNYLEINKFKDPKYAYIAKIEEL